MLFYAENLTSIDFKRLCSETDFEKQTCEVLTCKGAGLQFGINYSFNREI